MGCKATARKKQTHAILSRRSETMMDQGTYTKRKRLYLICNYSDG